MSENCEHCHGGVPPSMVVNFAGELTEAQLAELRKRFAEVMASPLSARAQHRSMLRLLSRRTRLRLWRVRQVDSAAIWLCYPGHPGAAESLWRLAGAWRRRAR